MGLEDFGKKLNAVLEEREAVRTDLRDEIATWRRGAQDLEERFDEIARGRASTEYSKPFGRAGIEGEKATIREEITLMRDAADRLERDFEALVRARCALHWIERYRKSK